MTEPAARARGRSRFARPSNLRHVDTWIFDLDDTLYPARCRLFDQIDRRICKYVASFLGVDCETARRLQKEFYREYGSTLRGMMSLHGMEPDGYLEYVHDIDLSPVEPDPLLGEVLARLPGRKLIFTSASSAHAERVIRRLGVDRRFDGIFDVAAAAYAPKPCVETYGRLLERHAVDPTKSAFFDDIPRNLRPAADIGMTTVWIPGRREWERSDEGSAHYVAEHLARWLDAAAPA